MKDAQTQTFGFYVFARDMKCNLLCNSIILLFNTTIADVQSFVEISPHFRKKAI